MNMNDIETNTNLLIQAAKMGNVEEVQQLIPLSDPKAQRSRALWQALSIPLSVECVKMLIPVSDPQDYNDVFFEAVKIGNIPCIEMLMQVANPKYNESEALFWSTEMRNDEIIDILIDVSDVDLVLRNLKEEYSANESWAWERLEEILEARRQKEVLIAAVEDTQATLQKRKM